MTASLNGEMRIASKAYDGIAVSIADRNRAAQRIRQGGKGVRILPAGLACRLGEMAISNPE